MGVQKTRRVHLLVPGAENERTWCGRYSPASTARSDVDCGRCLALEAAAKIRKPRSRTPHHPKG